jgi:hypothetical protein
LIDDITTSKVGTDWYGNKFGFQGGIHHVEPFGLKDFDTRIEYTRIKPWVYTHKYPSNTFNNYGNSLGYFTGPNSDVLFFEARKRFTRKLETSVSLQKYRHGKNYEDKNIGGDINDGYSYGDPRESHFLEGIREETSAAGIGVNYEIARNLFLRGGYTFRNAQNEWFNEINVSLDLNSLY